MNQQAIELIKKKLKISSNQVKNVLDLLEEGNTFPFIARYRKEKTGSLDEDQIRVIEKEYKYIENLTKRKEEVKRLIDEKQMLTTELIKQIDSAEKLQTVEDLYLPYKEKRKTKATEAIKLGFEPLAQYIRTYPKQAGSIEKEALKYVSDDFSVTQAIEQAGFIIAEQISENIKHRDYIRKSVSRFGILTTKIKKNANDENKKYEMYYDFSQVIRKLPSYRILAFNRGEKEKRLNVSIKADDERLITNITNFEIKRFENDANQFIKEFTKDAYNRLIYPTIEREIRKELTKQAESHAIQVFTENLEILISEKPLKDKIVLGVDPAFRTGCKLAVLDANGTVQTIDVIYPTAPKNDEQGAMKTLTKLITKYKIQQIVIGNGTASRETDAFIKKYLKLNNLTIPVSIISEAGASVYSASKIAQNEFPDLKVEERSAISIGRRIQDPMAELVKIEPKAIGVGQYQHDVNQKELAENLDFTMIKNINLVGINVNTASKELLQYVSGLDKTTAKNIVEYRNENGKFNNRKELKKVKRLVPKAYEQCAGFLKVIDGNELLDATFIHPESNKDAEAMIKLLNMTKDKLGNEDVKKQIAENKNLIENYDLNIHDKKDIIAAFKAPNIDFRDQINEVKFEAKITKIDDMKLLMKINGQVRNVVEFGAFVDIGLKEDALIHISQLSNNFISNVSYVLQIGDVKEFTVKEIDLKKNRIQLTLKEQ